MPEIQGSMNSLPGGCHSDDRTLNASESLCDNKTLIIPHKLSRLETEGSLGNYSGGNIFQGRAKDVNMPLKEEENTNCENASLTLVKSETDITLESSTCGESATSESTQCLSAENNLGFNYKSLIKTEIIDDARGTSEDAVTISKQITDVPIPNAKRRTAQVSKLSCDICHKILKSKVTLARHMKIHKAREKVTISRSDGTSFQCSFCDKAFNKKVKLKVHLRTHTGERPYTCSFCDKTFIQRPHLYAHERIHTNEKPYPCKYCPKAFTQVGNLQKHEMTHTGQRPFQCQFCSKGFITLQHRVDHERTHTGAKPWMCSVCGQGFAQNSTLNRHKQIMHTKQKPSIKSWFCGTCSIRFVDEVTFKKHQEVHDASIRSYVPEPTSVTVSRIM